ncbi:MAG: ribosome-associated translation inhibitor RaiA [Bacteroidales bacterium]|nr:ribosome-associated translation inhibitor RaiA [Bacteroidales bacterium]
MEINIKSLKFDADSKLIEYVQKKVSKLEKFFDGVASVDVILSLLPEPENKSVRLQTRIPGEELVIEKNARTFEEAVTDAADAMKEKIVRAKEKKFGSN